MDIKPILKLQKFPGGSADPELSLLWPGSLYVHSIYIKPVYKIYVLYLFTYVHVYSGYSDELDKSVPGILGFQSSHLNLSTVGFARSSDGKTLPRPPVEPFKPSVPLGQTWLLGLAKEASLVKVHCWTLLCAEPSKAKEKSLSGRIYHGLLRYSIYATRTGTVFFLTKPHCLLLFSLSWSHSAIFSFPCFTLKPSMPLCNLAESAPLWWAMPATFPFLGLHLLVLCPQPVGLAVLLTNWFVKVEIQSYLLIASLTLYPLIHLWTPCKNKCQQALSGIPPYSLPIKTVNPRRANSLSWTLHTMRHRTGDQ